jgi:hypothetical protein
MAKKLLKRYVLAPVPAMSNEEARQLEDRLRRQVDAWALYQNDSADKAKKKMSWPREGPPGINWRGRLEKEKEKIIRTLLPKKPKKKNEHP